MSASSSTATDRRPSRWLAASLLLALLCPLAASAAGLDWVTVEEMQKLPPELQQPIPEWCGGIYYSPRFATPPASQNTIIEADHSSYTQSGLAELSGNVTIAQPERFLSADRATLNQTTGDFSLDGDIYLDGKTESFLAHHLTGNTKSQQSQLSDVEFAIFPLHARGAADSVSRQGNVTLIEKGSYTTCAPDQNGWRLAARHIRLDQEKGWGMARDVTLEVKKVPVFYLPWITFPIDDRRKTGLLFPTFATSDSDGLDYSQPIYLNIAPQLDMTVAPRFISNRGTGVDTQTRYLTHLGSGIINYSFLASDRRFNNEDRSMASWNHSGSYQHWSFGTNVNYVSDDFYFKDLSNNTLDSVTQTELPRSAYLTYNQPSWQFSANLQSWQVIDPTLAKASYPFRRLPQLSLTGQPTIQGPLKVDWASSYTYFDQGVDLAAGTPAANRWHAQPAIKLPLTRSYGYITPQVRVYSTYYDLHNFSSLPEDKASRTLVGSSLDAGLFLERNLEVGDSQYVQTLEPRLFYDYIPYRDQDDLPSFDTVLLPFSYTSLFSENRFLGYDRIGDVNKLATGLTSRILNDETGDELWRFRVGQGYFFQDRRVHLNAAQTPDTNRTTPLVADATFQMDQHWSLYAQKQWDNGTNLGKQDLLRLGYRDPARRYGYIGYRKINNGNSIQTVQQGELAGMWPVSQHWSLTFSELYDLDQNRSLETVSGVEYRDCCWKLRLVNRRLLADYSGTGQLEARSTVLFQIQLIGLGGFGDKVDTLLENTVPGYRREDQ